MTAPIPPLSPVGELSDAHQRVREAILADNFVNARISGAQHGAAVPWVQVTIRPVLIRDERQWQIITTNGRQETANNYTIVDIVATLDELMMLHYKSIVVDQTDRALRVQFSKKGRPILHENRRVTEVPLDMAHDHSKTTVLPDDRPIPFLRELGIMTADGRVRADQRRKFRQINEFLRLLDNSSQFVMPADRPLVAVDLGCGSAALTFATYYYFNEIRDLPFVMTGVDIKEHLIARHQATAERLGWDGLRFAVGRIEDYGPPSPPDVVLALHACDTATDDALAQAVRWGSQLILSVPCCHHHLQAQLATVTPESAAAILRHGILRERLGDVLTDAFRAQILQMLGYVTDVIEFVPIEHTPKNLMIRAIYAPARARPKMAAADYAALQAEWPVTPYLADLLAAELQPQLSTF